MPWPSTLLLLLIGWWGATTAAANSDIECCPEDNVLNLDTYQCLNASTEANAFPQCQPLQVFVNVPYSSLAVQHFPKLANYCVGYDTNSTKTIVACIAEKYLKYLVRKPTVPKCCAVFQERRSQKCLPSASQLKSADFELRSAFIVNLHCLKLFPIEEQDKPQLLSNGSLLMGTYSKVLNQRQFCYEIVRNVTRAFMCQDHIPAAPPPPHDQYWMHILVSIGLVISIVFLVTTFLIYACELKTQNLYGKTLMCHIGSIVVAFACLATLKISDTNVPIQPHVCNYLIPYLMMFAFHATFFWLNVMSYDIWRTFRSIRSVDSSRRRQKSLRFVMYSVYAWGSPVIITCLTAVAANLPALPRIITPLITSCWISRDGYGFHLFFVGPIACVMAANTVMYLMTAYKCYQVKKEINTMHNADKTKHGRFATNKEQFVLSIKLFVVMGLTWSLDVVSYLDEEKGSTVRYLWYIPDIINSLYGLILFVIFALNKKNVRRMNRHVSSWMSKRKSESDYRTVSMNQSSVSTNLIDSTTVLENTH